MKWFVLVICLTAPVWADDDRENFEANAYLGLSIDTFAAPDFQTAIYSRQSETEKKERAIGGFDFQYRLIGGKPNGGVAKDRQLWLYGETLHGVRSTEVVCSGDAATRPSICATLAFPADPVTAGTAGKQLVHLLRNASSLEAYMGLRYEFLTLNGSGAHTARLYVNAQGGFMSVANSGGDVLDNHHVGLGAVAVSGNYSGSHLEVGYGRNDVFRTNRYKRLKVDGYLTFGNQAMTDKGLRPFVQMTVDSDMGRGSDSIQTFVGLNIHLPDLFK